MNTTKCVICNEDYSIPFYNQERNDYPVNFVICGRCGLVFQNPRPSQEQFTEYYQNEFRKTDLSDKELIQYIFQRINVGQTIFDITTDFFYSNPNNLISRKDCNAAVDVLDVGCGVGGVLIPFKYAGYNCEGIDTPSYFTNIGKKRLGLDIKDGFIQDFQTDKRYDIIILNHVFEHLLDPVGDLGKINSLLKDDGILYIEVPDITRPYTWKPLKYFFMLGHVFYYSPITIRLILSKLGFKAVGIDTENSPFMRCVFIKDNTENTPIDHLHAEKLIMQYRGLV